MRRRTRTKKRARRTTRLVFNIFLNFVVGLGDISYYNYDMESIVTPVNVQNLDRLLREANYDVDKRQFLINGFTSDFELCYEGDQEVQMYSDNLPLRCGDLRDVWDKMMKEVCLKRFVRPFQKVRFKHFRKKEVCLKRVVRPFQKVPFKHFIQSPVGLVEKQNGDTQLIFHLSHPRNTDKSVNANTPKEKCTVQYRDLDNAIKLCLQVGKGCYLAKSDMKSAFRHLPIRPKDWKWLK